MYVGSVGCEQTILLTPVIFGASATGACSLGSLRGWLVIKHCWLFWIPCLCFAGGSFFFLAPVSLCYRKLDLSSLCQLFWLRTFGVRMAIRWISVVCANCFDFGLSEYAWLYVWRRTIVWLAVSFLASQPRLVQGGRTSKRGIGSLGARRTHEHEQARNR